MSSPSPAEPVRVLAIVGSLRTGSHTRKAARLALEAAAAAGAEVRLVDLAALQLSLCDGGKAAEGKGSGYPFLREAVRASHGILLATPEYHGSFSGVLKNALDHLDIDDFQGKVVAIAAVAGGRLGAPGAITGLRGVARALKAWVLPDDASVPLASKAFDAEGRAIDPSVQSRLEEVGSRLARYAALHAGLTLAPDADAFSATQSL